MLKCGGDLDIEAALVAGIDAIEYRGLIGDDAGEDVEPAGGALGVGDAGDAAGERQLLHQRDDVDAALLQHRTLGEIDLVHAELLDLLEHGGAGARQEAGAHAVGDVAEAKVEARGLELIGVDRLDGEDLARAHQLAQRLVGEDAGVVLGRGRGVFGWEEIGSGLGHRTATFPHQNCHSRESGNPGQPARRLPSTPAFAGVTNESGTLTAARLQLQRIIHSRDS
jgi:hypothetical protein